MNILFISDNFYPETNAPAIRTFEHAKALTRFGANVIIITGAPNFPEGKLYEGYKNSWYSEEFIHGIKVIRVKTFIAANAGKIKRSMDFLSFMCSSFVFGLGVKDIDIVIATSPQFFSVISGYALSSIKKKPFIFELRDIWPASIKAVGMGKKGIVYKILEGIEIFLYKNSTAIVAVTNSFKEELIERGIEAEKIHVIFNGSDLNPLKIISKQKKSFLDKLGLENKFVVGYVGTHGLAHSLEKILDCAYLLKDESDIVFFLVGTGERKSFLEKEIKKRCLNNVVSLGKQSREDIPMIWKKIDVSLVSLKDNEVFSKVIPSKLFESVAAQTPLIMSMPHGEATNLVEKNGIGVKVPPEDPNSLKETILNLKTKPEYLKRMKDKCSKTKKKFSRVSQAQKLYDLLGEILS